MPAAESLAAGTNTRSAVDTESPAVASTSGLARPPLSTSGNHLGKTLALSNFTYLCVWGLVITLHSTCAVYLTQLARVYWFLATPSMDYWAKLASEGHQQYLRHTGVLFSLMAALHWWELLWIARASLRARSLVLPLGSSKAVVVGTIRAKVGESLGIKQQGPSKIASALMSSHIKALALPSRFLWRAWRFLFSRNGVLGVESDLFPLVFIVREGVEIASQSFQAHRSSELLPRPWLNNLFAALVVVNCWSTPVLQHFLRHNEGMERVICLLLDVLLNVGSSMFIPLAVFAPYYQAFLPASSEFPVELLYDALWFSRLVMENQLLFSLSAFDVFSRLVPHVGVYASLTSAATLIRRHGDTRLCSMRRRSRVVNAATESRISSRTNSTLLAVFRPESSMSTASNNVGPTAISVMAKSRASRWKQNLVHYAFIAWGLAVLVLHIQAVTRSHKVVPGCRQVTGSWFATKFPCSVYAYNCYREGVLSPSEDSWTHLDKASLVYLTIAHCSELTVPHSLHDFPNLLGFQLHNTTLVEWSKANAISATKHTKMVVLVIAKTNMTGIPDGILEPLPTALLNIQLTHTNLTTLPADLHTRWHPLAGLYIEHSLIATFPETLISLYTRDLSLHGNLIGTIPELEYKHQRFFSLALGANPLRELPEKLGEGTTFLYLSVERTLLKTLPAWVNTSVEASMFLNGTPYCNTQVDNGLAGAMLTCVQRDSHEDGNVPLYIFDPRIPL